MFHIIYSTSIRKMPQPGKQGCLHTVQGSFWCWSRKNTAAVLRAGPERPGQREWLHVARTVNQKCGHGFLHGEVACCCCCTGVQICLYLNRHPALPVEQQDTDAVRAERCLSLPQGAGDRMKESMRRSEGLLPRQALRGQAGEGNVATVFPGTQR